MRVMELNHIRLSTDLPQLKLYKNLVFYSLHNHKVVLFFLSWMFFNCITLKITNNSSYVCKNCYRNERSDRHYEINTKSFLIHNDMSVNIFTMNSISKNISIHVMYLVNEFKDYLVCLYFLLQKTVF